MTAEPTPHVALDPTTVESMLRSITELAVQTIPGVSASSVTLLGLDGPVTVTATSPAAALLDRAQYDGGHGPCLDAALSGDEIIVRDARTETRWPSYTAVAVAEGVLASVSAPIPLPSAVGASLNVYRRGTTPLDRDNRVALARLAGVAAASMAEAGPTGDAEAAAERRSTVDQARGVLMARHTCSAEQAFDRLRSTSQHGMRTIEQVAADIVQAASG